MTGNFERFQCFNFATNFLENENVFQKTRVPFFGETKVENASFPYKTAMQEAILRQIE